MMTAYDLLKRIGLKNPSDRQIRELIRYVRDESEKRVNLYRGDYEKMVQLTDQAMLLKAELEQQIADNKEELEGLRIYNEELERSIVEDAIRGVFQRYDMVNDCYDPLIEAMSLEFKHGKSKREILKDAEVYCYTERKELDQLVEEATENVYRQFTNE